MTAPPTKAIAAAPRPAARRDPITLIRAGFEDVVSRRRLIRYLVGADLKRTHSDTALGQIWWLLDPLVQMGVYYLMVAVIFQRKTPDFPLFLFAAILPWKWFSTTLGDATLSITGRQNLIRQVAFPKIVLPTSAVVAGSMSFVFGLIALGLVYLFYLDRFSAWVLLVPVIAAVQFTFTLALAIGLSAMNAFYRDVQNILTHAIRLWFYLSPAIYSLDAIDNPLLRKLIGFNPFAILFESYRAVTWGTTAPDWAGLGALLAASLVLLVLAVLLFKRVEPAFARVL